MEASHGLPLKDLLQSFAISDAETRNAVEALDAQGYLADPHSALAWKALDDTLGENETGVFLCTAHPAKFTETIEDILGRPVDLPAALAQVVERKVLSTAMDADFELLRPFLLDTRA
jgi:threonine synthase